MQRDLVIQAQHGDLEAFSDLTAGRTGRLFAAARLILRDDDRAADAVQDALLQAWLHLRALRDPDRFDGWLHRMLVRACYRAARRDRTRELRELRVAVNDVDPADAQRDLAVRDQLERGFRVLTTDQRTILVLRHYVGLSLAELAEVIDVPLGTVQSRLNRATQAMRAAIDADERRGELAAEGAS